MNPAPHTKGLRVVALFELLKGAVVLLVGFGLLSAVGEGAELFAVHLVHRTHLNPANRYPQIFIEAMAQVDNAHLWLLAGLAATYCLVRFVEAYGLWHERRWAEWFATLSGSIYVPVEIYGVFRHVSWFRVGALLVNLFIVIYMVRVLVDTHRRRVLGGAASGPTGPAP
ncbi:MAG: DUF2127 domain-containing protein [Opitutales bacterium]